LPLAQRVVVLNFGRKIADGTPDKIRDDPAVVDAYLGDPTAAHAKVA
jgi:ABC-type branched-subunit amino acid transport system ATPase component